MTDRFTVRLLAAGFMLIALVVAIGGIWLNAHDKLLSDAVIALGAGALGSAGTFLVSSRSAPEESTPVTVVNTSTDPVPVDQS